MSLRKKGDITFSAIGAYCEEFISTLLSENIVLNDIRSEGGIYYISANRCDYLRISRIASKYGIRTRITEKRGLYFRLYRFHKRIGIIAGFALAVLLILILECFVWKIEVHGNSIVSDRQVLEVLASDGIRLGAHVLSFNANNTEILLKRSIPDISWVSIDVDGSAVNVYISEAQEIEKKGLSPKTACNVIAGKSGTIVETQVYSGTLMYPVGSGVAEGNVIVSGVVNDGAGHLLLSHANAKIIADFTEEVSFSMPYTTNEKRLSGKTETEKELMLFGFVLPLTKKVEAPDNKLCSEYTTVYDIFGFHLPWKTRTYTYTEYEYISVTRRTEDIVAILEKRLDEYCENIFYEYELLETEKELIQTEECITLNVKIMLRGDIAVQKEIWNKR